MRPSLAWLITDTHWFHDKIAKACGRPDDYNEKLVRNCKHLIAEQDLLIHLGDVIFYKRDMLAQMLAEIPGRKILVMGNHDRESHFWYMRRGFDTAVDMFVWDNVLFSHKPQRVFPDGVTVNVHGHFHNTNHRAHEPQYNGWYNPDVHRLLAVEYTDYKPVELKWFLSQPPRLSRPLPSTSNTSISESSNPSDTITADNPSSAG